MVEKRARPMNKAAEEKLLQAVKEAAAWVEEDGLHPTDAVVKVAQERDLNVNELALLTSAYNTGRTAFQREKCSSDVVCAMSEFPLARLEDAREKLWPASPETPKQAHDRELLDKSYACYSSPPKFAYSQEAKDQSAERASLTSRTKAASVATPPRPERSKIALALDQVAKDQRELGLSRQAALDVRRDLQQALWKVAEYFREAPAWRESINTVRDNARAVWGRAADLVLDYASAKNDLNEKSAAETPKLGRPARDSSEPYASLSRVVKLAEELNKLQDEHRESVERAKEAAAAGLGPFFANESNHRDEPFRLLEASDSSRAARPSSTKEAGIFSGAVAGAAAGGARGVLSSDSPMRSTQDLVSKARSGLADPEHLEHLREIEAQTMLNDFLTNDEVLSGYDPEDVLTAYNEAAALSPQMAMQPAVMRSLLRRRLSQGLYDPFEAQQISAIEKTVSQAQRGDGGFAGEAP